MAEYFSTKFESSLTLGYAIIPLLIFLSSSFILLVNGENKLSGPECSNNKCENRSYAEAVAIWNSLSSIGFARVSCTKDTCYTFRGSRLLESAAKRHRLRILPLLIPAISLLIILHFCQL